MGVTLDRLVAQWESASLTQRRSAVRNRPSLPIPPRPQECMAESEEERHLKLTGEFDCDPEPLPTLRHSTSHVMAQAVKRLFPEVKVAIGPAIEDGFYYDFPAATPFTPEDLERIEDGDARDRQGRPTLRAARRCRREEAIDVLPRSAASRFKVEILEGIAGDHGLALPPGRLHRPLPRAARGVHRRDQGSSSCSSSSGAYWRGDEKNPMLQRIYGTAWLEPGGAGQVPVAARGGQEARPPQARPRARPVRCSTTSRPGAPFWLPNGHGDLPRARAVLRARCTTRSGYLEISTPILVNKRLWEQSGHWEHYSDNMFKLEVRGADLQPQADELPGVDATSTGTRSARTATCRCASPRSAALHRNERSGTLTGLFRVRQFTQDDAHIYCRPDQVAGRDHAACSSWCASVYKLVRPEAARSSSRRGRRDYLGTHEQWDRAEAALHEALEANGLPYELEAGRRRLLRAEDRLPRRATRSAASWQIATMQLDLPCCRERFDLEYVGADGAGQAAGGDPPRHLRLVRALHRHPDRALRGRVPDLAGAGAGARCCRSPRSSPSTPATVRERAARRAACGSSWTTATRSSATRSATRRCRKMPYMLVVGGREAEHGTVAPAPPRRRGPRRRDRRRVADRSGRRDRARAPELYRGPLESARSAH